MSSEAQDRRLRPRGEEVAWLAARQELVRSISANVNDPRVLSAFLSVPRHRFVPEGEQVHLAYRDAALPIGFDQTISQPSMIAIMLTALQLAPDDRVLEVGGGSGYAAALLAELAAEVYTVEIVPELVTRARSVLSELGYASRVHVALANGRFGLPAHAPYAKILVSAGAKDVPIELLRQLAPGGAIAIPVGNESEQTLLLGRKNADGNMSWQRSVPCIFVPLVERREGAQSL